VVVFFRHYASLVSTGKSTTEYEKKEMEQERTRYFDSEFAGPIAKCRHIELDIFQHQILE
jgi:hypothetical protein